jgi:hypothetical protein
MIADVVALIAFVLVGGVEHDGGVTLGPVLRTALPLLVAWSVLGAVVGTYRRPGLRTLVSTWIGAVPVAVVVRSMVAGGPWGLRLVVFLEVALAFTLVSLLAGRAATAALGRSRPMARRQ